MKSGLSHIDSLSESIATDNNNGWTNIENQSFLPPRSKPISSLFFPPPKKNRGKKAKERTSAHDVKIAYKPGTKKAYFVKYVNPSSNNAEIEALTGAKGKFLAPENVPSIHTLYDKNNKIIAVASRAIPDFVPNSDDPLDETDHVVEILTQEIIDTRISLLTELQGYIPCLERKNSSSQSISPINTHGQWLRNNYNYLKDFNETAAVTLKPLMDEWIKSPKRFSQPEMDRLLSLLNNRHAHKNITEKEKRTLEVILRKILFLARNPSTTKINTRDIEHLNSFNQQLVDKNINLNTLDDEKILPETTLNPDYLVTVKTMKNFRILSGLGRGLTVPYLGKNDDNHNRNMSKMGEMIDFDMYKFHITHQFKIDDSYSLANINDWVTRTPKPGQYNYTARDIHSFPHVVDFKSHFWATTATASAKSGINSIFEFTKNYFTYTDNENYKKLSGNFIFDYYFHQRLLKALLITPAMHTAIGALEMRPDIMFNDKNANNEIKNLLAVLVADEINCTNELKKTLLETDKFKHFLSDYADHAFIQILREFEKDKIRYENKLKNKPHYQAIYDAIDLEAIKQQYEELKDEFAKPASANSWFSFSRR